MVALHDESPVPMGAKVTLVNAFSEPFNNAMATARTCYASRVIWPSDMARDAKSEALRDRIALSTYEAGHHTTLQHATFQFVLENVSRHFIWSFLHAHPFYNSEQVSQRYVTVKQEHVYEPPSLNGRCMARYRQTVGQMTAAYRQLVEILNQPAADAYFKVFGARKKQPEKYRSDIKKRAQEVARYVLPVSTYAYLYHTISGLTLHRYHRLANTIDVPTETRQVVLAMVEAVRQHDPLFFRNIEDSVPLEQTHEAQTLAALGRQEVGPSARAFINTFDAKLNGKLARLVDYSTHAEATLAESVRCVLGAQGHEMTQDEAIALVLDPTKSSYLKESLNLTSLGKLTRTLTHPHYTFAKKLSHAADSQDQRHRTSAGARPILTTHYAGGNPDVVEPSLMAYSAQALDLYHSTMQQVWSAIDDLLSDGTPAADALYLLPNAVPIRFMSSGDLMSQHHKWVSRLCYNAQEEIWRASCDEVEAVAQVHPGIAQYIGPPCQLRHRAKARPICPEGARFCGVPVWKIERKDYLRVL